MAHSPAESALGYAFIGVMISIFLYGIIVCQTYFYIRQYPHDRPWMKGFVLFLVFADTLHTAFSCTFLYDKLIIHFDNDTALQYSTWLFETYPALVGIISASVQMFFAWRVKILTGNLMLFGLIALLSFMQIGGGVAYAVEAGRVHLFSDFLRFRPLIIAWLSASALCDILITGALSWTLQKQRNQRLVVMEDVVRKIIRLTLQNGLITTVWTVSDLIIAVTSTHNGSHFIFCYTLAKLYINSLISTLNARPVIRDGILPMSSGHSRLMSSVSSWDNHGPPTTTGNDPRSKAFDDDFVPRGRMSTSTSPLSLAASTRPFHVHNSSWDGLPLSFYENLPVSPPSSTLRNEFPRAHI